MPSRRSNQSGLRIAHDRGVSSLYRSPMSMSAVLRRGRGQRGASAVELALVLPFLVLLTFGLIQYGWYFYVAQTSSSGAREAARRIIVGDCRATNEALNYARNQSGLTGLTLTWGAPSGADNVTPYSGGSTPAVGDVVRVKVQANGEILGLLPMPGGGTVTRIVDTRNEDNTQDKAC